MSLNYISRVPRGLETAQSDCREQRLLSFEGSDSHVNGSSGCTTREFERQLRARFFFVVPRICVINCRLRLCTGHWSKERRRACLGGPEAKRRTVGWT